MGHCLTWRLRQGPSGGCTSGVARRLSGGLSHGIGHCLTWSLRQRASGGCTGGVARRLSNSL